MLFFEHVSRENDCRFYLFSHFFAILEIRLFNQLASQSSLGERYNFVFAEHSLYADIGD